MFICLIVSIQYSFIKSTITNLPSWYAVNFNPKTMEWVEGGGIRGK